MLKINFKWTNFAIISSLLPLLLAFEGSAAPSPYAGIINIRAQQMTHIDARFDVYQHFLAGLVPKDHKNRALGSGAYLDAPQGGLIVTNYHFLKNAQNFFGVEVGRSEEVSLRLLGIDEGMNIAVLEPVEAVPWRKISLGQSSALALGESVSIVASPFGLSPLLVKAHVAAKGGIVGTSQTDKNFYLDKVIKSTLSGAGVFEERKRLVGITSAFGYSEELELGLLIPIDRIRLVLGDLKKFGTAHKFWLGIIAKNIYAKDKSMGDPTLMGNSGVIVENLIAGGPAQKAGIKIGDIITSINGMPVSDSHKLQELLWNNKLFKNEKSIVLQLFRRGKGEQKVSLGLEERPKAQDLPKDPDLL